MTDSPRDHHIRLSIARRIVTDYMWAASGVARVDVARWVSFGDVITARNGLAAAPSWTAIFTKAFAIVAAEIPQLRQFYMKLLWPHLFEYGESTACILQEREILGDIGLFPLRIRKPDGIPLAELTKVIRRAADASIEDSTFGRVVVSISRLPLPFRRLLWSLCLNVPRLRRHGLGTYGVSSVARWHSELGTSRTPLACLLSYGPADAEGKVRVRLSFDHRVFDGALAGRVLSRLDQVLNSSILAELHELAKLEGHFVKTGTTPGEHRPDASQP